MMGHALWAIVDRLRHCRFIDLTHAFDETIPHSPLFDP
jgi:hypothetical protein